MRAFIETILGERRILGRYLLLSVGLAGFTLLAAQGVVIGISALIPDQAQRISASGLSAPTRTYTVTRSVLDDGIVTGSIPRPQGIPPGPCKE